MCFELLSTLWFFFFYPSAVKHEGWAMMNLSAIKLCLSCRSSSNLMISSPETTSAGLVSLICWLWLGGKDHLTFLLFNCSWAGGSVQNRWHNGLAFCLSVEYFAGCRNLLWKAVIRARLCFDLQHRGWQWTASHSLFFFPSYSFVVDVWLEETGWMSAWFWGVQITFYWPIIPTQEVAVWSIPVRTR